MKTKQKNTEDAAKRTTDSGQRTIQGEEKKGELSEAELRQLMGPAACSAIGWEPRETEKQKREWRRRRHRDLDNIASQSALCFASNAQCTMHNPKSEESTTPSAEAATTPPNQGGELLGGYWRVGELVVLTGRSGIGKGVLGMGAAAKAASAECGVRNAELEGWSSPGSSAGVDAGGFYHPGLPATPPDPGGEFDDMYGDPFAEANGNSDRRVLYIDLERSEEQVRRRMHSVQCTMHNLPGPHSADCLLPTANFEFAWVGDFGRMPSRFKGSATRFFVHSVKLALENRDADVVVVDNLAFLVSSGVKAAAELRVLMKTLRRWVNETGKSLMIVAHSMSLRGKSIRPGEVVFAAGLEMADRVVALCPSTISANYRYLKTVYPFADEAFVESYQLGPRGFESMGVIPEEQHLFDYRGNARVVGQRIAQLAELFPERRKFRRTVVPSKVRFLGIEDAA